MGNPTALKCILAGCPHEAAAPSSYCVFHKTPTDREREALTSKDVTGPRLEDIRENGDACEYSLRIDVTSDTPEKVKRFCDQVISLVLGEPGYANYDVAVSVHRAEVETDCNETGSHK